MITLAVFLVIAVLSVAFGLLGFVLRALGLMGGGQLAPHVLSRRRAAGAAFAGAFCVYLAQTGGWLLDQLPPWVPSALMAVAGASLLLVLAGIAGARERDPSSAVVSLMIAGGGYALLQWKWSVPRDYFAADYVPADLINRLLPGVYIAMMVAGLARALLCMLPLSGARQPTPYDAARLRAVAAAFVFVLCLYVLNSGQSLLGALPSWVPGALEAGAALSLLLLASGFWATRDMPRDMHGIGMSLAVAAAAVALLWWDWQMPPGPASAQINDMLPGLYIAALIAALVRALICARLLGGAERFIKRLLDKRNRPMRPMRPALALGFWAEMRDSFMRGLAGRPWRDY
jgi:hypothetical protein